MSVGQLVTISVLANRSANPIITAGVAARNP